MAAEDEEKGYGTRHAGVGRLLYSATDHDVSDENASATVRLIPADEFRTTCKCHSGVRQPEGQLRPTIRPLSTPGGRCAHLIIRLPRPTTAREKWTSV